MPNAAAVAKARGVAKVYALWKQGWNEIPEVMASTGYGLIGAGLVYYGWHRIKKYDLNNHRYKAAYLVMRPDDVRVERIRRFEDSPQMTRTPASLRFS